MWAVHVVHHSSEHYNLSTALRQPVADPLGTFAPYGLLSLFGVRPELVSLARDVNLLYQYWIHTDTVRSIGPFEEALNTPSHHRVHHGVNPQYIDKNYAGVFIIWDHLFGTFEPEGVEPVYGLVKPLGSFNPLWANLHYWVEMARMARQTRRLPDKLRAFVAPPEWRPGDLGGTLTIPEPDRAGPSFVATPNRARDRIVVVAFLAVLGLASWFLYADGTHAASPAVVVGAGLATLAGIVTLGLVYSPPRGR
jgi:hypothetical protein